MVNDDKSPSDAATGDKAAEREARRAERKAVRQAERQAEREAQKAERRAAREAAKAAGIKGRDAGQAATATDKPGRDTAAMGLSGKDRPSKSQAGKTKPGRAEPATLDARPPATTPRPTHPQQDFDILIVAQGGGIDRQAAILAASLRRNAPGFLGRLIVAEPQPEGAWQGSDPRMSAPPRAALTALGAEIRPLVAQHFGRSYPYGNKIEALALLDPGRPFLFLDSDTLILDEIGAQGIDFARPSASMRREGTWPEPPAYKQTYDSIWRSLYDRFGLEMDPSLDLSQPEEHWERFLYFNAGWFFGPDAAEFGRRFTDWAVVVRDDPGEALACQSLDPWLDQVVLPLVIHSLGGGRPGPELAGMDGDVTCHYRNLPLLYVRAPDTALDSLEAIAALPEIAPLMQGWEPAERLVAGRAGRDRIRPMFADSPLPPLEKAIRKRLRAEDLWLV